MAGRRDREERINGLRTRLFHIEDAVAYMDEIGDCDDVMEFAQSVMDGIRDEIGELEAEEEAFESMDRDSREYREYMENRW